MRVEANLTPDGHRYLAASQQRVARPFHYRWLTPLICRRDARRWTALAYTNTIALALLAWAYTGTPWMACCALLPGVDFNRVHPVLVDATAMTLALGAAVIFPHQPAVAVLVVLAAGCTRETAPVWAAVYAWHPLLLVGLAPVAVRHLMKPGPDVLDARNADILAHPIRYGLEFHRDRWLDAGLMVLPWGGLLVGVAGMTPQLALALVLGYGQLLVATDSVRLYQWAWPVLALAAVGVVPAAWLPLIAITVIWNPWRGPGI